MDLAALILNALSSIAAVAAAIVALRIATKARRHDRLMRELDVLLRLLENRNRGGSSDPKESRQMGAEALTLVGLVGPRRLPRQWARQVEKGSDGLRELLDSDLPEWKKDAIEAQIAVNQVQKELDELR